MFPELSEHFLRHWTDFNRRGSNHGVHQKTPISFGVLRETAVFKKGLGLHEVHYTIEDVGSPDDFYGSVRNWYALLPIHIWIFSGLLKTIARKPR